LGRRQIELEKIEGRITALLELRIRIKTVLARGYDRR
jgi:type II restriction/modification system DNA methylase subunit YeeA